MTRSDFEFEKKSAQLSYCGSGHLGIDPGRVNDARKERCSNPSGVVHNSPWIAHSAPKLNKARMRFARTAPRVLLWSEAWIPLFVIAVVLTLVVMVVAPYWPFAMT